MQKLKQLFTLVLLVCVLASSHTFAMYQHTCLITGIKKSSFLQKGGFCVEVSKKQSPLSQPIISKASCCKLEFKVFENKTIIDNPSQSEINFILPSSVFNFDIEPFLISKEPLKVSKYTPFPRLSSKIYIRNSQFLI
jgi:hypothetical protein